MVVNCDGLPLSFQIVELNFIEFNIQNTFKRYRKRTLLEALEKDEHYRLTSKVKNSYSTYHDVPLGEFLYELKKRGDKFYIEFLHSNGDKNFCKFKMKNTKYNRKKGLYYYFKNEIKYIGMTTSTFRDRINSNYGNISPKNCYKGMRSTNCRINHLINENQPIYLYLCVLAEHSDREIGKLEKKLILQYDPPWNLKKSKT